MRDFAVLVRALDIVENNLRGHITVAELAGECYVSVSGLQKLFRYVFGYPVGDYLSKRRLSAAAHELVNTDTSITDIALTYRYASPEAFSRAFKRFWGVLPSEYRRKHRFSEIFPKLEVVFDKEDVVVSDRKKLDVSRLYDELKKLSGTYVLCVDICGLARVNEEYGMPAGDLVIAETARRMDSEISRDMLMFRIGRDEFVAVTGLKSADDVWSLARRIIDKNGTPVLYEGVEIPVSVRIIIDKIPVGSLSYRETLDRIFGAIDRIKGEGVYLSIITD